MDKKKILIISVLVALILLIILVIHGVRTKPKAIGFPLSLNTVRSLKDGRLSYEVRNREIIMVTVVDKYGDSHIHILDHSGVSQQEALLVLSQKQDELGKQ